MSLSLILINLMSILSHKQALDELYLIWFGCPNELVYDVFAEFLAVKVTKTEHFSRNDDKCYCDGVEVPADKLFDFVEVKSNDPQSKQDVKMMPHTRVPFSATHYDLGNFYVSIFRRNNDWQISAPGFISRFCECQIDIHANFDVTFQVHNDQNHLCNLFTRQVGQNAMTECVCSLCDFSLFKIGQDGVLSFD